MLSSYSVVSRRSNGASMAGPTNSVTSSVSIGGTRTSAARAASVWSIGDGTVHFKWNNRLCTGMPFHGYVLHEELQLVEEFLEMDRHHVHAQFSYEAQPGNVVCTGEPIHLAVTRSSVPIVEALIHARANLGSCVRQGLEDHYDVLHAAVFSEGRGGLSEVVKCLLDAKAPPTKNHEGHYPLHLAFQNGGSAFALIPMLRQDMQERGLLGEVECDREGSVKTPLELGIENGKLTREQLVQVAPTTPVSLRTFLRVEPICVPAFLLRLKAENCSIPPEQLVEFVTVADVCTCLRECSDSVCALLDGLLSEPLVENPGWHPLPMRLSFAPRSRLEVVRNIFNPPRFNLCTYQREKTWAFDAVAFHAPAWHAEWTQKEHPILDVGIKVCHMPEIVCADVFHELCHAEGDVFGHPLVRSMVNLVWWQGACKVDIMQLFLTMVGLILMVVDQGNIFGDATEDGEARRLVHLTNTTDGGPLGLDVAPAQKIPYRAALFIGARGVVDLVHEGLQFAGCVRLGRAKDYLTMGNCWDVFRAVLAIRFYCQQDEDDTIQVFLILISWFRLLEMSFSEYYMKELLPITMLAKGLAPSTIVCCVAVCAFTHARWAMFDSPLWPDIFYDTFALLITAGIPAENDTWILLFSYIAVSCFTVFFLNIFISVISENYAAEKGAAAVSFERKKYGLCYTFLIRALMLPGRLMSTPAMIFWTCASVVVQCFMLAASEFSAPASASLCGLVFAQGLMLLCCYQDPAESWSRPGPDDPRPPRYLWVFQIWTKETPSTEDRIQSVISEAFAELDELHKKLVEQGFVGDSEASED